MEERLFSTGDFELDLLLTEVYYSGLEDGYDYAQREFSEKDDDKKRARRTVAAGGIAAGGAALALGSEQIPKKAVKGLTKVSHKIRDKWTKTLLDPNKTWDQADKIWKRKAAVDKAAVKVYENSGKISKNLKRAGIGLAAAGVTAGIANEIIRRNKRNRKLED